MSAIVCALLAAAGVHLLLPRPSATPADAPRRPRPDLSRLHDRVQGWLNRTGLESVSPLQFATVSAGVGVTAGALCLISVGGMIPAVLVGVIAATVPATVWRRRHQATRDATLEAWPRMIEEIRVRVGSVGQPIPQALLETGVNGPLPLSRAFAAAQRQWALTTDFEETVRVLKGSLADPTADAVCETLLVIHQVGGDPDVALEALAADRRSDLHERREADARSAGARLARWFVIVVPAGMAFAGLNLGNGREAFRSGAGQLASAVAISMIVACWWWAGRIMATPPQQRVFDR